MAASREKIIQTAERFVARGKVEAAIREYRKVLADHPRDTNTLNRVGDLYARIERNDEAIALFTRIAEHYTDDGFFVKAIAIYKKIIKLDPTRLEIYERLAELYHRQGLVNEARTQYHVLADYFQKHGDLEAAVGICGKMLELEPNNLSHRAKLADLYQQQGKVGEAMAEYRAVGEEMLTTGQPEAAVRVYEKALEVDAEDIPFITNAVLKLREAGHEHEAGHLVQAARKRNPRAEQLARLLRAGGQAPAPAAGTMEAAAAAPALTAEEEEAALLEKVPPHLREAYLEVPGPEEDEAPAAATQEVPALDEAPVLDAEDTGEVAAAAEAAAAAEEAGEAGEVLPSIEFDLDMDEVFVLDLDDDAPPASLVQPPADLLDKPPGATFGRLPGTDAGAGADAGGGAEGSAAGAALGEPEEAELEGVEEPAATEAPGEPVEEFDVSLSGVIDLAGLEPEVGFELEDVESGSEPTAPSAVAPDDELVLDAELLERTAAELEPAVPVPGEEDLVTEAEVLAKYGLPDKALERVRQALKLNPQSLRAYRLNIVLQLEAGRYSRAAVLATEMALIASELGDVEPWKRVEQRLLRLGFEIKGNRVSAGPGVADSAAARGGVAPAETEGAPGEGVLSEVDAALAEITSTVLGEEESVAPPLAETSEPELAAAEAPALAEPPPTEGVEEVEEPEAEAAAPAEEAVVAEPTVPASPPAAAEEVPAEVTADEGIGWLDELAPAEGAAEAATAPDEQLFDDEEGFFDLAAELEKELKDDAAFEGEGLFSHPQEQSLEEIVEGFKRGVAEHLSEEDYETHFNLGIAYREMGLLDEAIGEFQLASKDLERLVDCCSMLGMCFLDKGLPELAVKWYRRGLKAKPLSEEDSLGLLYDLGNAYLVMGEKESAYKTFVNIYGINTNYRDVVAKLEELGH